MDQSLRRQCCPFFRLLILTWATFSVYAFEHHPLFNPVYSQLHHLSGRTTFSLFSATVGDPGDPNKEDNIKLSQDTKTGYRFGDITRGVLGKFQSSVNSLTGKESYEFGDLSKWLDAQAKGGVVKLDQSIKKRIQQFTQRPNYRFGDITRELIRRFQDGDYNAEDLWLFMRIALLISKQLVPPVAAALPVRVLMELVEVSMAQSVSEDLTSILTSEVNQRMKQFIIGDKTYQIGDITKKILTGNKANEVSEIGKQVVGRFTGQDVSTLGDVSKRLWKKYKEKQHEQRGDIDSGSRSQSSISESTNSSKVSFLEVMDDTELNRFEEWDRKFLASKSEANRLKGCVSKEDFQLWDQRLLEASDNVTEKIRSSA